MKPRNYVAETSEQKINGEKSHPRVGIYGKGLLYPSTPVHVLEGGKSYQALRAAAQSRFFP